MKQCTLDNVTFNAPYPRTRSDASGTFNCGVNLKSSEVIKINNVTFTDEGCAGTRYNGIEIDLNNATPSKLIDINNVRFEGELMNNGILIFATQSNAVINIRNCYFKKCSNPLRFSNALNATGVTINIIDCVVDAWDDNIEWSGFIIFQDYTSGSKSKEINNNLFGPNKLNINITNLVHAGKRISVSDDKSSYLGKKDDGSQLAYIWNSKGGYVDYDESRYPTFNIK